MIASNVELSEQLGGKMIVIFENKDSRNAFRKLLKIIPVSANMDGEDL